MVANQVDASDEVFGVMHAMKIKKSQCSFPFFFSILQLNEARLRDQFFLSAMTEALLAFAFCTKVFPRF